MVLISPHFFLVINSTWAFWSRVLRSAISSATVIVVVSFILWLVFYADAGTENSDPSSVRMIQKYLVFLMAMMVEVISSVLPNL